MRRGKSECEERMESRTKENQEQYEEGKRWERKYRTPERTFKLGEIL